LPIMAFARLLAILVAIGWLGPAQAWAQPSKWWQEAKTRAELGLSQDQVDHIEEIFQKGMPALREGFDELRRLEDQLSKLIASAEVSEAEVVRQVTTVEARRAEVAKARTLMFFRIRRVLSSEQRTRLTEVLKRVERERGRPRGPIKH
jgi:Spy/CpxP family protein refolding chaperone